MERKAEIGSCRLQHQEPTSDEVGMWEQTGNTRRARPAAL